MLNIDDAARVFDSDSERKAYQAVAEIGKIRVGHFFFEGAIRGIGECIKASAYDREPVNCMLLGQGGMGKTSVAQLIIRSMKPETITEDDLKIRTVPAFYTSFRSGASLDALTTDMLRKLGDPASSSGKVLDKASRVLELLIRCRTKIIFIDELHDLDDFKKVSGEARPKLLKWVKAITNGGGPVTCLMGLESCHNLFEGDTEMGRRFKKKSFLRPLMPGTGEAPGLLEGFLTDLYREIVETTSVTSFPDASYLSVLQVWAATGGSLDFTMTLIKEAALRAMLDNRMAVEVRDFAAVWDTGVLDEASVMKFNPFLASHAQLATAIREKRQ